MPHQCVHCNTLYDDGAKEILTGCPCGSRFFFFMKKQDIEEVKNIAVNLTEKEKDQIEKDALELVGEEQPEKPIILDLESIRIVKPGKFELDLVEIFKGKPLVYKLSEGKYIIDVASVFKSTSPEEIQEETETTRKK